MKQAITLFSFLMLAASAADAQSPLRLKASSTHRMEPATSPNPILVDSSHYSYSPGRGSYVGYRVNMRQLDGIHKFDEEYQIRMSGLTGMFDSMRVEQTFNGNNNIETTTYRYYEPGTGVYKIQGVRTNAYNSQHMLAESIYEYNNSKTKTVYTYTSTGLIESMAEYLWDQNTQQWSSHFSLHYSYDAAGRKTSEEQKDSGGTIQRVQTYTYTTDGRLATSMNVVIPSQYKTRETYTYNGNGGEQLSENWNAVTQEWKTLNKYLYTYGVHNNITSWIRLNYNNNTQSFDTTLKDECTYNDYGQIVLHNIFQWDQAAGAWKPAPSETHHFYYEQFTTGINQTATVSNNLKLFPVPAGDVLHIAGQWQQPQSYTLSITDMQGRVVLQWQQPEAKDITNTIPLSGLAPGIYVLKLTGEKETITRQFVK